MRTIWIFLELVIGSLLYVMHSGKWNKTDVFHMFFPFSVYIGIYRSSLIYIRTLECIRIRIMDQYLVILRTLYLISVLKIKLGKALLCHTPLHAT